MGKKGAGLQASLLYVSAKSKLLSLTLTNGSLALRTALHRV